MLLLKDLTLKLHMGLLRRLAASPGIQTRKLLLVLCYRYDPATPKAKSLPGHQCDVREQTN